jgi:hypothetical protein
MSWKFLQLAVEKIPHLFDHVGGDIGRLPVGVGQHEVGNVAPRLGPHVAQQMGWDGSVGSHQLVAVLEAQVTAHVGVQLLVQWTQLVPQTGHLVPEVGRLVALHPHFSSVGEICIKLISD